MRFPAGAGWRDLTVVATAAGVGATAPSMGTMTPNGYRTYYFADSALDELFFCFHINHDYRAGTDIYFHIHWSPSTNSAGNADFKFDYSYAPMQSTGPVYTAFPAVTTGSLLQAGGGTAWLHQVTEAAAFQPTNLEPDGLLLIRAYRDGRVANANDTFAGDAYILTADLHYEIGQLATYNRVRGDGWVY
jgi:hypothetical protein